MDLVVNVSEDWGIGKDGKLLVSISADLKRFRALTTGKAIILGRKTLATFPGGRPLKNRRNLILSSTLSSVEGAECYPSMEALLPALREMDSEQISVIGGQSVYLALLPYCSKAYITKTLGSYPADAFFPNLDDMPEWHIAEESEIMEEEGIRFQYVDYVNSSPLPL